jgi:hypothetical protein
LRGQHPICADEIGFARRKSDLRATSPVLRETSFVLRGQNPVCALKIRFARPFFNLRELNPADEPAFQPQFHIFVARRTRSWRRESNCLYCHKLLTRPKFIGKIPSQTPAETANAASNNGFGLSSGHGSKRRRREIFVEIQMIKEFSSVRSGMFRIYRP